MFNMRVSIKTIVSIINKIIIINKFVEEQIFKNLNKLNKYIYSS